MVILFKANKPISTENKRKRFAVNSILVTIGYILSPLSWWNDMLVNVPLAYIFSIPFTLIKDWLFLPGFILGYLLTNIIGFVLMHKGISGLLAQRPSKINLMRYFFLALLYTLIVMLLVWFNWIPSPRELIEKTAQQHNSGGVSLGTKQGERCHDFQGNVSCRTAVSKIALVDNTDKGSRKTTGDKMGGVRKAPRQ